MLVKRRYWLQMKINNRRYIGSKTSLLSNIDKVISKYYTDYNFIFADLFSGTGVVAEHFFEKGCKVIVNDILYSNYVSYQTWMSNGKFDIKKITELIEKFNSINPAEISDNYFSDKFGNKYFHINDAKKIGDIREKIEEIKNSLSEREYYILLSSLLYETDKIANTCGHFESFLNSDPEEKGVSLRIPEIYDVNNMNEIYCEDANLLVKRVNADVVYIDPPYNARQYVNFYHVLENLARWEKPEDLEGNSMKFKRNHLKSDYSKSKAPIVFKDLIDNIDASLIVVSYNNTYNAKSGASNNKISEKQLLEILKAKGKVSRKEIKYKAFNAGKTDFNNHKEYLYVCEVFK